MDVRGKVGREREGTEREDEVNRTRKERNIMGLLAFLQGQGGLQGMGRKTKDEFLLREEEEEDKVKTRRNGNPNRCVGLS